jgi:tRNA threonylcarbamoyladenosine dehydratase
MEKDQPPPRSLASTAQLYSADAFAQLRRAHIAVIGLGGVGSWAAEALGRSGVGRLTLVDYDHVVQSNLNRQVQAGLNTLGKAKTQALAERLAQIAPATEVACIDAFLTPENAREIRYCGADFFIDACDDLLAKQALILQFAAKERTQQLVVCGAAGGKRDPGRVMVADMAQAVHDPLLSKLRYGLRKGHRFARDGKMQVTVVFSTEPMARGTGSLSTVPPTPPQEARGGSATVARAGPGSALACAGYGSSVMVTATIGLQAAARAVAQITSVPVR